MYSQVHAVLEGWAPVILLADTLLVRLRERGVVVKGGHGQRELRHRVEGGRAAIKDLLDELRNSSTGSPVAREGLDLLLGWDLASKEEPEETLREGLRATRRLGERLLDLRDGLATEADTLIYQQSVNDRVIQIFEENLPASRTEPSQIRAGRPRMPLECKMSI